MIWITEIYIFIIVASQAVIFSININFDSFPDEQMDEETHKLMQETKKDMKHNFLNNFNPHTSQADEEHELTIEEVKAQSNKRFM